MKNFYKVTVTGGCLMLLALAGYYGHNHSTSQESEPPVMVPVSEFVRLEKVVDEDVPLITDPLPENQVDAVGVTTSVPSYSFNDAEDDFQINEQPVTVEESGLLMKHCIFESQDSVDFSRC